MFIHHHPTVLEKWGTAGSAATTSCHYTDYHPCQSRALPSPGVSTVGKLEKGALGATSEDTGENISRWTLEDDPGRELPQSKKQKCLSETVIDGRHVFSRQFTLYTSLKMKCESRAARISRRDYRGHTLRVNKLYTFNAGLELSDKSGGGSLSDLG